MAGVTLLLVSVAVMDVVSGPSVRPDRSSTVDAAPGVSTPDTTLVTPSVTVITAVASASRPVAVSVTAATSVASIARSGAVIPRLPSSSADVSGAKSSSKAGPLSVVVLPSASVAVTRVVAVPSASALTSSVAVPSAASGAETDPPAPSRIVTVAVASASRPVRSSVTAVSSPGAIVASVMPAPRASAMFPSSSADPGGGPATNRNVPAATEISAGVTSRSSTSGSKPMSGTSILILVPRELTKTVIAASAAAASQP